MTKDEAPVSIMLVVIPPKYSEQQIIELHYTAAPRYAASWNPVFIDKIPENVTHLWDYATSAPSKFLSNCGTVTWYKILLAPRKRARFWANSKTRPLGKGKMHGAARRKAQ